MSSSAIAGVSAAAGRGETGRAIAPPGCGPCGAAAGTRHACDAPAFRQCLEVPLGLVQATVIYYGAYPDEIDEWIELIGARSTCARGARGRAASARAVKLLLDEMFAPVIARALRSRGHDVESVSGRSDRQAFSDAEVMDLARRERRAVLINNRRDFRPLRTRSLRDGPRAGRLVGARRTTSRGSSRPRGQAQAVPGERRPRRRRDSAMRCRWGATRGAN